MKTKFIMAGVLMAALASATVYADDAQTQMNGQMGQTQTAPAMPTTTTDNQNATQAPPMGTMGNAAPTGNTNDMNTPPSPPASNNNSY